MRKKGNGSRYRVIEYKLPCSRGIKRKRNEEKKCNEMEWERMKEEKEYLNDTQIQRDVNLSYSMMCGSILFF